MPSPIPHGPYAGFGLSYWLDFERPRFGPLEGDISADVAIVGAGISGVKLAHYLGKLGVRSVVLEGGVVGDGASGRNQGSMNHGTSIGYTECINQVGRENARALWNLGLENQRLAVAMINELGVKCSYEALGFVFMARSDEPGFEEEDRGYRSDAVLLNADGFHAEYLSADDLRADGQHPLFVGGLRIPSDSQFHSGRYVAGMAQSVARAGHARIFDETRVLALDPDGPNAVRVTTSRGVVRAARAFLLTNALVPQFVPGLARGILGERGQVLVTEPLSQRPCRGSYGAAMAWWREIPEPDGRWRLLFGGGRKRDEPDSLFRAFDEKGAANPEMESEGFSASDAHQRRLDAQFHLLFPQLKSARVTHRWGGLQGFTADSLPVIGEFDPKRRIHGMAAFCGRGNAYTDVGAQYLAGKVAGVAGSVEKQFEPVIRECLTPGRGSANW
ncbi:MAG: FAD-binding oxidoreductase [Planctomycetota bacterium]|nr:FAD-binding oxidoreductase [Planctomycetota bacterium]